jgi:glycosyl transferase family 25
MSHNIDKIYYINLNKRVDRKEQIEKELDEFGLSYERFEAIETPGIGIYGCGLSHLAVLKLARENNYENVLILEDDFTFLVSKDVFEQQLTSFFDLNIHFDVLMLSYALNQFERTNYELINKAIDVQTASGYIVNKCYYDKLIDLYEWAMPLLCQTNEHWNYANDQVWKRYQPMDSWYCFATRIGKQAPGYSDNTEQFYDYNV